MTPAPVANTEIHLALDRQSADYSPGDALTVEATSALFAGAQSAELSVLWLTVGKGDEDLFVHDFQRISGSQLARGESLTLATVLPMSPLSYAGRVVKVCWCARLRLNLPSGKQLVAEASFHVGRVAPAPPLPADAVLPEEAAP